jgi:hypothetical protein
MAAPIAGQWAQLNANANDYSGALKWGTGVSPLYGEFGEGPPLGIEGRNPEQSEFKDVPASLLAEPGLMWGYTAEDILPGEPMQYMVSDVPSWDRRPEDIRYQSGNFPPPSLVARPNGPSGRYFRTLTQPGLLENALTPASFPTETVSEGWDNKLSGEVLAAETSAQSQYERQTSMQQVDPPAGRNNDLAVQRGTDDARHNIRTRLTGMKIKPWSEGQRLEDMFPFQQDMIIRPFWYRNAATGRVEWLQPNEFQTMEPITRTPPPEPDYGPQESGGPSPDWGYTPEDTYGY